MKLLMKELRLASHPTVYIFWLLSAMLMIPEYPYYVAFFYTTLGIFFVCLNGRESHDIEYSLSLPVRKRDVVKGRFEFVIFIEIVQLVIAVPFAVLRQRVIPGTNPVGMDANIALFGMAFILFGLFNNSFLPRYYRAPAKVGRAFLMGSTVTFVFIMLAELGVHIFPLMSARLDTPDPKFLMEKLVLLGFGVLVYAALTYHALRRSVRSFEALDI